MGKAQSKEELSQDSDGNQDSQREGGAHNSILSSGNILPRENQEEIKSNDHLNPKSNSVEPNSSSKMSGNAASSNTSLINETMKAHPVFQEHGENVYRIHSLLENIFKCTFYSESCDINQDLRLLQNDENSVEEKILFTFENFDDLIQKILESPLYFMSDEKLIFLHNIYTRLHNTATSELFSVTRRNDMMQVAMSYTVSYLTAPEVFSSDIASEDATNISDYSCSLYDMFYRQLKNITHDIFVKSLVNSLSDDDYEPVLGPMLKRILRDCVTTAIEDTKELMKAMELLEALLGMSKKVADFFLNHDLFLPRSINVPLNGLSLQKMTIFGACLAVTAFPNESKVTTTNFTDRNSLKNPEEVIQMLRAKIHSIIDVVHKIMEQIMKLDSRYKRNILDWLYTGVSVNDARQKTYNYGSMVSTDGWFTNYLLLLVKFSHKMLEEVSKYPAWFEKIDFSFLRHKPIFNNTMMINGQTIVYIPGESTYANKEIENSPCRGSPDLKNSSFKYTFLSELVIIMNHAVMLQSSTHKMFVEFLQKLQKQQQNQNSRNFLNMCIKKFAYNVQLSDPYLLTHISKLLTFDVLLMLYLLEIPLKKTDDVNQLFEDVSLLKDEEINKKISLPIYWAENIQDCVLYLRQVSPSILLKDTKVFDILMNYILKAISKQTWITNPHLRAKYLQIISSLVPLKEVAPNVKVEDFGGLFIKNQYYKNNLVYNLFNSFLEVEKSSASSQFYEKFSYRYGCCVTLNYLLNKLPQSHKDSYAAESLLKISSNSREVYIQFWTLALNDMVALLDETLTKLQEVKTFQGETSNQVLFIFTFHDRHDRMITNEQNKKLVQTFLNYLNAYYGMLAGAVRAAPKTFLDEDLKEKFVVSVNYSIQQLTGFNFTNLKMKTMRELQFDPKGILENLTQIILQFQNNESTIKLIAHDERSFSVEIYRKLLKTLRKRQIVNNEDEKNLEVMIEKLDKEVEMKNDHDKFIAEMKDIPEEFVDPIMNVIMKDPVLLPSSHTVVDRTTILKHLLVDATDPFNRSDLNKDMLIPQEELKNKIEAFFTQKRKEKEEKMEEKMKDQI